MAGKVYPVVILAGGPTPEKIMETGETEKERAFLKIDGKPMLQYVLDALRTTHGIGETIVIGNRERILAEFDLKPEQVLAQKSSLLENFMMGMEHFRDHDFVLSTTCDIPLVTSVSLEYVINQTKKMKASIYYPIIDVAEYDKRFPGGKRTVQKLKEGTFTGGNVFVLDPKSVIKNREKMLAIIRDRKSPAKLVKLLGFGFILRFALKMLDLQGLEKKATEVLGAEMRGIITPYPEIGFDVDKPDDLAMVRDIMAHA